MASERNGCQWRENNGVFNIVMASAYYQWRNGAAERRIQLWRKSMAHLIGLVSRTGFRCTVAANEESRNGIALMAFSNIAAGVSLACTITWR
jgi:hypothetical protein